MLSKKLRNIEENFLFFKKGGFKGVSFEWNKTLTFLKKVSVYISYK